MATVKYLLRSCKNPTKIYLRFVNGKAIDIQIPLNIFINPKYWNSSLQKIRNVIDVPNRDALNKQLSLLKYHVFDVFNEAYTSGEVIDSTWLRNMVSNFFNRPKFEENKKISKHTIYYTDFGDWWMTQKASTWLISNNAYMGKREINKYKTFLKMVKEYQGKDNIKLKDLTNDSITGFTFYLNKNGYAPATIKRHISRFKFFCLRAEQEGMTINKGFKQRVFAPPPVEIKEPYLDEKEIQTIYNHDFSDNGSLDNVRDNLIIACWTGLRVSDFLNQLDTSNFIDDFIEITTQKTQTAVVIPIHPMVKRILIKRKGELPTKTSDQKFNEYVKIVCEKAGINSLMKGRLYDKDKKRKLTGEFKKYLLVSSHIGRRSFATNHFGKIQNSVIMAACGWSNEKMMLKYIKKSNREHAVELKKYWDEIYN